jgi:hypothetical protein
MPNKVSDLKCSKTRTGGLLLTWNDKTSNSKYKATSFLVIVRNRKREIVVRKPRVQLEGGKYYANYHFTVIAENFMGQSEHSSIRCTRD